MQRDSDSYESVTNRGQLGFRAGFALIMALVVMYLVILLVVKVGL